MALKSEEHNLAYGCSISMNSLGLYKDIQKCIMVARREICTDSKPSVFYKENGVFTEGFASHFCY